MVLGPRLRITTQLECVNTAPTLATTVGNVKMEPLITPALAQGISQAPLAPLVVRISTLSVSTASQGLNMINPNV